MITRLIWDIIGETDAVWYWLDPIMNFLFDAMSFIGIEDPGTIIEILFC